MYSGDNHEVLVPNGGGSIHATPYLWVLGGNHGDPQTLVSTQYLLNPNYALFAPYLKSVQAYKCPADRATWTIGGTSKIELRSYAMNCYVATPSGNVESPLRLNPTYRVYMKTAELASDSPANRFIYIDVNPASICTPAFGLDMDTDSFIHYPSAFHGAPGVAAFADTHVECHKWLDARTRKGLPPGRQYIPHDDPSPRNIDLTWLRQRATSRK
jgi:hypothetical protein